jgi:hypothetical protein
MLDPDPYIRNTDPQPCFLKHYGKLLMDKTEKSSLFVIGGRERRRKWMELQLCLSTTVQISSILLDIVGFFLLAEQY